MKTLREIVESDDPTKTPFRMSELHPDVVKAKISKLISKGTKPTPTVFHHEKSGFEGTFNKSQFAPMKKLRATQDAISAPDEDTKGKGSPFPKFADKPIALKSGGQYHILDGHNRLAGAKATKSKIAVNVFHDDKDNDK